MINAENINVNIGGKRILSGVSLKIESGEFLTIVGRNGAGKSTLLRVLTGDITNYKGSIEINGRNIRDYSLKELATTRAVLPQISSLAAPFTVEEIVLMGRIPYSPGSYTSKDIYIVDEILEQMELLHLKDRIYPTLSGGEMQRVQIARILTQLYEPDKDETKYIFLDEPTNNLDLCYQYKILSEVRKLANANFTVIAVIHDLNLAAQYSTRMVFLNNGEKTADGNTSKVLTRKIIKENLQVDTEILNHYKFKNPLVFPLTDNTEPSKRIFINIMER
jgi:iron complex transport system ATP-binding protein